MDDKYTKTKFLVNGRQHSLEIDNRHTLLDILRDYLGLTGAKKGCDLGECGACTVLLDGKAVNSCQIFAARIKGKDVRTVEGLAQNKILHPLQISFIENDGGQCGYCTPGMVMSAIKLVENNPKMTEDDIRKGLEGNICRCTGYHNIVKSIKDAATVMGR